MGKDVFKHHFLRERGRSPSLQEAHKPLGGWDLPAVTKTLALATKRPQPVTSSSQKHHLNPNSPFWAALIARLLLTTCLASPEALMVAEPAAKIGVAVLYSRCIPTTTRNHRSLADKAKRPQVISPPCISLWQSPKFRGRTNSSSEHLESR